MFSHEFQCIWHLGYRCCFDANLKVFLWLLTWCNMPLTHFSEIGAPDRAGDMGVDEADMSLQH